MATIEVELTSASGPKVCVWGDAECEEVEAVIPEGIALDPLPEVVPEDHRITLRRSVIWASTSLASML